MNIQRWKTIREIEQSKTSKRIPRTLLTFMFLTIAISICFVIVINFSLIFFCVRGFSQFQRSVHQFSDVVDDWSQSFRKYSNKNMTVIQAGNEENLKKIVGERTVMNIEFSSVEYTNAMVFGQQEYKHYENLEFDLVIEETTNHLSFEPFMTKCEMSETYDQEICSTYLALSLCYCFDENTNLVAKNPLSKKVGCQDTSEGEIISWSECCPETDCKVSSVSVTIMSNKDPMLVRSMIKSNRKLGEMFLAFEVIFGVPLTILLIVISIVLCIFATRIIFRKCKKVEDNFQILDKGTFDEKSMLIV